MKFFTALFIVVILYINGFDAIQVTLFDRTDNRGNLILIEHQETVKR